MDDRIVAFDIGNTRVKGAAFVGRAIVASGSAPHADESALPAMIDQLIAVGGPARAVLSSVNAGVADRLRSLLAERAVPLELELRSDGWLLTTGLLASDVETPTTTGVDRLLSAIAALARSPGRPVIVVDCGSAITVNLTTADRVFRGGAITPGLRLLSASLRAGTAALPEVALPLVPSPLGRSTAAAIQAGIYYSAAAGIDRLIAELLAFVPDQGEPAIYLTGGDAPFLQPAIRTDATYAPHLVLEGLGETAWVLLNG